MHSLQPLYFRPTRNLVNLLQTSYRVEINVKHMLLPKMCEECYSYT